MSKPQKAPEAAPEATPEGESLLELVLAEHPAVDETPRSPPARIDGVVIGVLVGFGEAGEPLVEHPENPTGELLPARAAAPLGAEDVGREAALLFERGDPTRPIVMGLIHNSRVTVVESATAADASPPPALERDPEELVFSAQKQIVLKCGKASITLLQSGKVLIKGAYVLTRSSGVNRIQGGSVQIN